MATAGWFERKRFMSEYRRHQTTERNARLIDDLDASRIDRTATPVLGVLTLTRETWPDTLMRMATQHYFALGAACYVLSIFVWILGLSRVPVSVAYPLLSLGYIVNAIAAHYLFGEAVTATRWIGAPGKRSRTSWPNCSCRWSSSARSMEPSEFR